MLWAVWGHFQGGSLCLTSVCWSLQCLISVLTWWGGGGHFFFFFQAHLVSLTVGREGCCKQITLSCACSVSAPLGLPLLTVNTTQALCCSTGNCLRPALGCMHLPGLSHSGSLSGSPQRCRFGWACVLCPSQDRVAQVFGERGRCDLSPFPAAQFLGVPLAPLVRRTVTVQDPKTS